MTTWHANVAFTADPFEEDAPFDLLEELAAYGASMSVSRNFDGGGVTITLDGGSIIDAMEKAVRLIRDSASASAINVTDITAVEVLDDPSREAWLSSPIFPEVVGFAEVAQMAGVSRQRAREFRKIPTFPPPVIETAQGPLMAKTAVEAWVAERPNRRRPATV